MEKAVSDKEPHPEEGFPTLTEMIEFLVESKFLSKPDIDQLTQKYMGRKK